MPPLQICGHCRARPKSNAVLSTRPTASRYDPINRSIEEERRVQVLVRDNNVDQAFQLGYWAQSAQPCPMLSRRHSGRGSAQSDWFLPHRRIADWVRADRSLHQQSGRTRRAHDEAPPENLRRLPIVRRRDGLRGHPLLFLDRQEAELEHHRRRDQRALKLGEIPTPFVSYPANLGSNVISIIYVFVVLF